MCPSDSNPIRPALPARARADDVALHEHFLRSALRTRDPDAASLFFVPVYLGRLFNWFWGRPSCDEEDAPPPPLCRREQVRGAQASCARAHARRVLAVAKRTCSVPPRNVRVRALCAAADDAHATRQASGAATRACVPGALRRQGAEAVVRLARAAAAEGRGGTSGRARAAGARLLGRAVAGRGQRHGRRGARRPGARAAAAVLGPRQRRRPLHGVLIRPRCPPPAERMHWAPSCTLYASACMCVTLPVRADSSAPCGARRRLLLKLQALASASNVCKRVSPGLCLNRALRDGGEPERGRAGRLVRHTVVRRPGRQACALCAHADRFLRAFREGRQRLHASGRPSRCC